MKKERVILSFIALLIGLMVAGGAFFLYENAKASAPKEEETVVSVPTPSTTEEASSLKIDKPQNEDVISSRTVTISGKTEPNAVIVAQSAADEQVAKASANGSFQFTLDIEEGLNTINVTAILADGTEVSEIRTITYSQEDF